MLSQFKLSLDDLKNAILSMNDLVIDKEGAFNLKQYVPTTEEITLLKGYTGDVSLLPKAEQYFMKVMTIPRLQPRMDCFHYKLVFFDKFSSVAPDVTALMDASNELMESEGFQQLLETLLALGNYLNGGGFRGGAFGFKLELLSKVKDVKSGSDPNLTLLRYLVRWIRRKDSPMLYFADELGSIAHASRVSLTQLKGEMSSLSRGLNLVQTELPHHAGDDHTDAFRSLMTPFVADASSKINQLNNAFTNMEKAYAKVLRYFVEPPNTKTEDFFGMVFKFMEEFREMAMSEEDFEYDGNDMEDEDNGENLDSMVTSLQTGDVFRKRRQGGGRMKKSLSHHRNMCELDIISR